MITALGLSHWPASRVRGLLRASFLSALVTLFAATVLGVTVNVAGGTSAPRNVSITTGETASATLRWDAPASTTQAVLGYLVVALGRGLVSGDVGGAFSPTNRVAVDPTPGTASCYIVI